MPVYVAQMEDPYTKGVFRITLFSDTEREAKSYLSFKFGKHVEIISIKERDASTIEQELRDIPEEDGGAP